ncbi:MAG: alginate export family protein [Bdellovibrionaceae bacterium]|nr:alginate export family protein [Pseudobdellovibrionaceae bacterium]
MPLWFMATTILNLATNLATGSPDIAVSPARTTPEAKLKESCFDWRPGDPMKFSDGRLIFDVQNRLRMELRNNTFDFNDSINGAQDDTFLLQRFRIGAQFKPLDWLAFYASGQDARELFSEDRPDTPFVFASEGDDTFDLREAFVEVGNLAEFPLSARIGRQAVNFGDERLVGSFDWNNFGRTFDMAKLTFQATRKFSIDVFVGSVVYVEGYEPGDGDHVWEFNESKPEDDLFYGLYATDKNGWLGFQQTELYFLGRIKNSNPPFYTRGTAPGSGFSYDLEQDTYTIGFRVKSTSTSQLKGFDYEANFAYQFGNGSLPATGAGGRGLQNGLDLSAFAAQAALGYNLESVPWSPRIGIDYAVATGDEDPADGTSQSFMNLFPTNHKFYGEMDTTAWKNIHNPSINLTLKPNTQITLKAAYHWFFLHTNEDAWYRANAVAVNQPVSAAARNAGSFVGSELDLTGSYAFTKWLSFQAGYAHFFSGDYLQEARPAGNGDDADFFYLQSVVKF